MTWVINKAFPEEPIDKPFKHYNRTNGGDPQGALVPQYAGERVLDVTNGVQYMALGPTNNTWVESGPIGPD